MDIYTLLPKKNVQRSKDDTIQLYSTLAQGLARWAHKR